MNREEGNVAAGSILCLVLVLIDPAIFEKTKKSIEQALKILFQVLRIENGDVMQILKLVEQLREES